MLSLWLLIGLNGLLVEVEIVQSCVCFLHFIEQVKLFVKKNLYKALKVIVVFLIERVEFKKLISRAQMIDLVNHIKCNYADGSKRRYGLK